MHVTAQLTMRAIRDDAVVLRTCDVMLEDCPHDAPEVDSSMPNTPSSMFHSMPQTWMMSRRPLKFAEFEEPDRLLWEVCSYC